MPCRCQGYAKLLSTVVRCRNVINTWNRVVVIPNEPIYLEILRTKLAAEIETEKQLKMIVIRSQEIEEKRNKMSKQNLY